MRSAFADIGEAPGRWLGLLARKAIHFGNPSEIAQMFQEFDGYRDQVWVLRLPLDARTVLLLALLAPLGLWLEKRPRALSRLLWPMIFLVGYAGIVVLFFLTSRYRAPVIPAAMALASVTVVSLWNLTRAWLADRSKGIGWLLACVILLGACSYLLFDARNAPFRIEVHASTKAWDRARVLAEQGETDEALTQFETSLAEQETWQVHWDYAVALWRSNRVEDARPHLQATLRLNPAWTQAWFYLGELRRGKDGDMAGAREAYDQALRLDPDFYEASFGLGAAYLESGEPGLAAEHLRRFLSLAPPELPMRPLAEQLLREAESRPANAE
jgi:tetratricopeptide (TPR) repeat protein